MALSIIVASFTKVAANQLLKGNLPLNDERIGTLHALCHRLLDGPTMAVDKKKLPEWNAENPDLALTEGVIASLDDPFWEPSKDETKKGDELSQEYHVFRGRMIPTTPTARAPAASVCLIGIS